MSSILRRLFEQPWQRSTVSRIIRIIGSAPRINEHDINNRHGIDPCIAKSSFSIVCQCSMPLFLLQRWQIFVGVETQRGLMARASIARHQTIHRP